MGQKSVKTHSNVLREQLTSRSQLSEYDRAMLEAAAATIERKIALSSARASDMFWELENILLRNGQRSSASLQRPVDDDNTREALTQYAVKLRSLSGLMEGHRVSLHLTATVLKGSSVSKDPKVGQERSMHQRLQKRTSTLGSWYV